MRHDNNQRQCLYAYMSIRGEFSQNPVLTNLSKLIFGRNQLLASNTNYELKCWNLVKMYFPL